MHGDMVAAAKTMLSVIDQARNTQQSVPLSYSLANLAVFEVTTQHPDARAHAEEATALARSTGSRSALLYPLIALAMSTQDDPERALAAAHECMRIDPSERQLWSTTAQHVASMSYFERGAVTEGLRLARSTIAHLHWTGDRFNLVINIGGTANNIAPSAPAAAVQLGAIAESNTIAPWAVFETPGLENLQSAAERAGPDVLEAARAQANSMTYNDAIETVLHIIDQQLEGADPAVPDEKPSS
jgi:hypothetical protein